VHCFKHGSFQQQIRFLRHQFLQDGDLPFNNVLSVKLIEQALIASGIPWKDRIYSPLVTLWLFLGQVLSSDHSCRAAVGRLLAQRASRGLRPCSAQTGAYCQARKRLPEKFFAAIARQTGRTLDANVDPAWLWKRRRVYMFDGSSVSMPDTAENQKDDPQPDTQKSGLGFPLARIAAVFSLSCGAVLDIGICRYAGKGQGELSLLRRLSGLFSKGDVLLGDRLMCSWVDMAMLKERGVDSVTRLSKRRADFRTGRKLGKGDHIVQWMKPSKPRLFDNKTYASLPEYLTVRETRVQIEQAGFRTRRIVVVTTIVDTDEVTASDLAELYRIRWNNETYQARYAGRHPLYLLAA
jgi:hypothetical protein